MTPTNTPPGVEQGCKVLERETILLTQLEAEKNLDRMIEVAEGDANSEWKSTLRLAGLMVQDKSDIAGRIIHDGTHHCHVNPVIVVNERTRSPTIRGKRFIMSKIRAIGGPRFCLKGSQGFKLPGPQGLKLLHRTFVNAVGTQVIGSAAMWWARLIGAAGRMVYHLLGTSNIYQLIYADDFDWTAHGGHRLLLGPLYAWVSVLDKSSCLPPPLMVHLIFRLLREIHRDDSMRMSEVIPEGGGRPRGTFRVDARAESDIVEAGGRDSHPPRRPKVNQVVSCYTGPQQC
jgi:hypothetical protein